MTTNAQLLKMSFELIQPETFTHIFYTRLFDQYPMLRPLFVQDMYIQERSLAATLQMIVQMAEQPENFVPVLYRLGKRHTLYGVQPEHYALLKMVLVETFSFTLGERFTSAMRQAWLETYAMISEMMQKAALEG